MSLEVRQTNSLQSLTPDDWQSDTLPTSDLSMENLVRSHFARTYLSDGHRAVPYLNSSATNHALIADRESYAGGHVGVRIAPAGGAFTEETGTLANQEVTASLKPLLPI